MSLANLVSDSARRDPDAIAVRGPDGAITYSDLDAMADCVAHALRERGVGRGDRVGIWADKSVRAVVAMQAVLRLGAAYVPLDPMSPTARVAGIVHDCAMRAVVTTESRAGRLLVDDLARLPCVCLEGAWHGESFEQIVARERQALEHAAMDDDDLAYVLYTSGSTGRPKGVCISQRNALAFIEWAAKVLDATANDRFSNHAPFHFDLSVLDLYVAFLCGGSVTLIPDGMTYAPQRLVELIQREGITVWYSVPSVLILMMNEGGLLDVERLPLRALLFAGEPFPIKHLQRLVRRFPSVRYMNLYGPTETNVCTYYELEGSIETFDNPVPIGRACSGDEAWAQKDDGTIASVGEEGELIVRGPTVMLGYWGQPPLASRVYSTGDIVRLRPDGHYDYIGRRDQMVKVRGHRIELGEVEAALALHAAIDEAAVLVVGEGMAARLVAFVSVKGAPPTLLEVKRHCAERLPRYMIVDEIRIVTRLLRTRNGKVDRIGMLAEHATFAMATNRIERSVQ